MPGQQAERPKREPHASARRLRQLPPRTRSCIAGRWRPPGGMLNLASRYSTGHVAEWLRNGLQNRVPRFNSGRGLHRFPAVLRPTFARKAKSQPRPAGSRRLSKRDRLCYMRAFIAPSRLFPGSSAVEQPAVNRLVAGSNPARGANAKIRVFACPWFFGCSEALRRAS